MIVGYKETYKHTDIQTCRQQTNGATKIFKMFYNANISTFFYSSEPFLKLHNISVLEMGCSWHRGGITRLTDLTQVCCSLMQGKKRRSAAKK